MADHILTGATGFVGSHLLTDLLTDDTTGRVHALARGTARGDAAERVSIALQVAGHTLPDVEPRLAVIDSELTQPHCGVELGAVPRSSGPLVFWHVAASLEWRVGRREHVFGANVDGTRHALELATMMGTDLFVHVSTAYSCGTAHGDIPETLHRPRSFSNVYEESKCAAEHLVAGFEGLRTVILRPSVIVGTSRDYRASGSYTGLYGAIHELRRFKKMLGDSDQSVRYAADRTARISFIPVDHVVEDARAIVAAELAAPRQGIYHVTGASESDVGGVTDHLVDLLGLEDRLFIVSEPFEDASPLERLFAKRFAFFSDYLRTEKRFLRRVGPARGVSLDELKRYIDAEYAL